MKKNGVNLGTKKKWGKLRLQIRNLGPWIGREIEQKFFCDQDRPFYLNSKKQPFPLKINTYSLLKN